LFAGEKGKTVGWRIEGALNNKAGQCWVFRRDWPQG